jgi:hypothetical protein
MTVITGFKPGTETILERLSGSRQEPINMQRRILMGGALAAALASSGRALAEENHGGPDNPFILLLKGIYQPVAEAPANNLGLTTVMLNDGSYSKTRIYPIFGILESNDQDRPIGTFYVQLNAPSVTLCAYDLPGGALAMSFNPVPANFPKGSGYNDFATPHPDGEGGNFLEGTWELVILEATGIYRDFQGGHNHMVDKLHQLAPIANGRFDEFCFCIISQYQFP